jgi:MraZ protein
VDFYNQFEHTIDAKGRLVLPAPYRGAFGDGGMLTFINGYGALFTTDGWDKHRRRLESTGTFTPRELQYLWAMAAPFVPDAQNRIVLSPILREKAHLDGEVTIVGSVTHAAIYPREAWLSRVSEIESQSAGDSLAAKFEELGFL